MRVATIITIVTVCQRAAAQETFVITGREETTVNYGHKIEIFSISQEKYEKQAEEINEYLELTLERLEKIEEDAEKLCEEEECENKGYKKPPQSASYYNSFHIRKMKGKWNTVISECKNLPAPITKEQLNDLRDIIVKENTNEQPVNMKVQGNYILYHKALVFADNMRTQPPPTTEASQKTAPGREMGAIMLEVKEGEISLNYVKDMSKEVEYLCLFPRSSLEYNEQGSMKFATENIALTKRIKHSVQDWSRNMLRCPAAPENTMGTRGELNLTTQQIVKEIRSSYYAIEKAYYNTLTTKQWDEITKRARSVQQKVSKAKEQSKRCQMDNCIIRTDRNKIQFWCNNPTTVQGTKIRGTPVPFRAGEMTVQNTIDNVIYDYGHHLCLSMMNGIMLMLQNSCCQQITAGIPTDKCPHTVLHEGPMAYQSGAKTFVVSPERGTVTTRCGTRDESVIADAEGMFTDCTITLEDGEKKIVWPGFGKTMMGAKKREEETWKAEWTTILASSVSLTVLIVLFMSACFCPCFLNAMCRCMSGCRGTPEQIDAGESNVRQESQWKDGIYPLLRNGVRRAAAEYS
jgi:hypothetical protein